MRGGGGTAMITAYPLNGPLNFNTWHLFGDPSMQVRMGLQQELVVQHPDLARPGDSYIVSVCSWPGPYPPNPDPTPHAAVCLWKSDDDFHTYALTDLAGHAVLTLPLTLTPGPIYVTVTKNDHAAYEGSATVTLEPPPQHPDQGEQAGAGSADSYAGLCVHPPVAGRTFTIAVPRYARVLRICDGSGRVVQHCRVGSGVWPWQGTDQLGRQLPEGVYFIETSGEEKTEVAKVLLLQ